jgi:hypothetical protein
MSDAEIQDFVTRFAAAWAARDGKAFLDLWHPRGLAPPAPYAAGLSALSSLASRWISALLIAACRVGALICAPSKSVT